MTKKATPTLIEQVLANRGTTQAPAPTPSAAPVRDHTPVADLPDQLYTAAINQPVMPLHYRSIQPDPAQARWVLPGHIRARYLEGQLDAADAMREWIEYAKEPAARTKQGASLAEAAELGKIADLAGSIQIGGQVQPLTVIQTDGGWRIETGERRFWAHVYLIATGQSSAEAATIPATKQKRIDPFRQAVENQFRDGLSAIAIGREVVRLLAEAQGTPLPWHNGMPTLNDYRQLAVMDLRGDVPEKITRVLQMSEESLYRYKKLLLLPDAALEIADRHRLTEGQLRPILSVQGDKARVRIVELIAELNLTVKQMEWLCKQRNLVAAERELRNKGQATNKKARSGTSEILYSRCAGIERAVGQAIKEGHSPAKLLARQYVAQKGKQAASALRELSKVLAAAAREAEGGRTRNGKKRGR